MESDNLELGWARKRLIFLGISAVFLVILLWWAADVLLPFIIAVVIAYVLTPLVAWCERRRLPRWVAIILVYLVTVSVVYLGVAGIAPRVYAEARALSREMPAIAAQLAGEWGAGIEERLQDFLGRERTSRSPDRPEAAFEVQQLESGYRVLIGSGVDIVQEGPKRWRVVAREEAPATFSIADLLRESVEEAVAYARRNAFELIRVGQAIISRVTRGVFLLIMTLMVAAYLMHTRDRILSFFRSLAPPLARPSFERLLFRIDRGLSGVVRGQLLICLVNGILSAIGFAALGLKYWPTLAIVAGIMSIIPIFGSILSTIPAVLVALTQDVWTALWVLLWIVGIHQLEANLLNPKIIGVAARLHPVMVVFSLILGEHTHGLSGALLAVPLLSVCQSLFNHFRFETMPDVPPDSVLLESQQRS